MSSDDDDQSDSQHPGWINRCSSPSIDGYYKPKRNRIFNPIDEFVSRRTRIYIHGYREKLQYLAWDYNNHWHILADANHPSIPDANDDVGNSPIYCIVDEFGDVKQVSISINL